MGQYDKEKTSKEQRNIITTSGNTDTIAHRILFFINSFKMLRLKLSEDGEKPNTPLAL